MRFTIIRISASTPPPPLSHLIDGLATRLAIRQYNVVYERHIIQKKMFRSHTRPRFAKGWGGSRNRLLKKLFIKNALKGLWHLFYYFINFLLTVIKLRCFAEIDWKCPIYAETSWMIGERLSLFPNGWQIFLQDFSSLHSLWNIWRHSGMWMRQAGFLF